MSNWTMANIRIRINGQRNIDEIQRLIGYSCDWESIDVLKPFQNKDAFLPIGQEGTLMISVAKTTKKYTDVIVYGGLRGVWSTEGIAAWIESLKCKSVRSYSGGYVYVLKIKGYAHRDSVDKCDFTVNFKRKRGTSIDIRCTS